MVWWTIGPISYSLKAVSTARRGHTATTAQGTAAHSGESGEPAVFAQSSWQHWQSRAGSTQNETFSMRNSPGGNGHISTKVAFYSQLMHFSVGKNASRTMVRMISEEVRMHAGVGKLFEAAKQVYSSRIKLQRWIIQKRNWFLFWKRIPVSSIRGAVSAFAASENSHGGVVNRH